MQLEQQDLEMTKFEIDCSLETAIFQKGIDGKQKKLIGVWSEEQNICAQAYLNLLSTKGKGIKEKILTDQPLTQYEKKYKYVYLAAIGVDHDKESKQTLNKMPWLKALYKRCMASLMKDFQGEPLHEEGLENFRETSVVWNPRKTHETAA